MTNNERFNQMINACEDPERMLAALLLIVPAIRGNQKTAEEGRATA